MRAVIAEFFQIATSENHGSTSRWRLLQVFVPARGHALCRGLIQFIGDEDVAIETA